MKLRHEVMKQTETMNCVYHKLQDTVPSLLFAQTQLLWQRLLLVCVHTNTQQSGVCLCVLAPPWLHTNGIVATKGPNAFQFV